MKNEKFTHTYKIVYIQAKVGQTVGRQDTFEVSAGSKDEALDLFKEQQKSGYNYHIQYWES